MIQTSNSGDFCNAKAMECIAPTSEDELTDAKSSDATGAMVCKLRSVISSPGRPGGIPIELSAVVSSITSTRSDQITSNESCKLKGNTPYAGPDTTIKLLLLNLTHLRVVFLLLDQP